MGMISASGGRKSADAVEAGKLTHAARHGFRV